MVYILLSQDDTFFTSVKYITVIGIQGGTLAHFTLFLELNSSMFFFEDSITYLNCV